jgi:hypothetical protein
MSMVEEINAAVARIDTGHKEKIRVMCATRHHGVTESRQLTDIRRGVRESAWIKGSLRMVPLSAVVATSTVA